MTSVAAVVLSVPAALRLSFHASLAHHFTKARFAVCRPRMRLMLPAHKSSCDTTTTTSARTMRGWRVNIATTATLAVRVTVFMITATAATTGA